MTLFFHNYNGYEVVKKWIPFALKKKDFINSPPISL